VRHTISPRVISSFKKGLETAAAPPAEAPKPVEEFDFFSFQPESEPEPAVEEPVSAAPPEEKPLVYEVTLEKLMAMVD